MSLAKDTNGPDVPFVRARWDELSMLPGHDDGRYRYEDLPDGIESVFRLARYRELIKIVDTERCDYNGLRGRRNVYQTSRHLDTLLDKLEPDGPRLPCGHSGFQNYGQTYSCGCDLCDSRYDRETIAEVYG